MAFRQSSKADSPTPNLAFHNDKGISYARHSPAQVETERTAGMAKLRDLVAIVGPDSLPPDFLEAMRSGDVATDLTGQYIDHLKTHFRDAGAS